MRIKIILVCSECNSRNYTIFKNTANKDRFELVKYCRVCGKRTLHKESK